MDPRDDRKSWTERSVDECVAQRKVECDIKKGDKDSRDSIVS